MPTCYSKAIAYPKCKNAMAEEYNSLVANHIWDRVAPDPNKNLVGCKWVFKVKENYDGSIKRYKYRLVP